MRGHHFLPGHYLWSLNCVVFAQASQTQSVWPAMLSMNHIVGCNSLCWDMWSKMKVITESLFFQSKSAKKGDGMQEVKITLFKANSGDESWSSAELISVSHRSLGSPLSSLSSSWSVVQVLLAVLSLLHQPRRWWDNSTLHSRGLSWP